MIRMRKRINIRGGAMRMWMVNPMLLCNQHLLGEHVECHMFVGCIRKSKNLSGYLRGGLLEIHNLQKRHDDLVIEMKRRGFKHGSPLPKFHPVVSGKIDLMKSFDDLRNRCKECRIKM